MKHAITTITLFAFLALPALSGAHPGRLDKDGCHHVRKDFTYSDGKVLKAGTYHCHIAQPDAFQDNLFGIIEKEPPKNEEKKGRK